MTELGVVTRALLAIAREVRDDRVLAAEICQACVAGLAIDGAAISLFILSTMRETLYSTDATAERLEDLQFTVDEGACIDAAATGRPVLIPDMNDVAETSRWPVYAAAVAEQTGVGAVFALPLQWGAINLGVLNLYRRAPGSLPRDQLRDAMRAAGTATLMLLGLHTDPGDDQAWDGAWGHRAEIHQATGMVVAQLGVNAQDAFARLRAYAFAQQRLLSDVARDVVQRRLRFDQETL